MRIFAFEWNDCIHEASFSVVSLHTTKKKAYKAMRAGLIVRWHDAKKHHHNESKGFYKLFHHGLKPLQYEQWRVMTYIIDSH